MPESDTDTTDDETVWVEYGWDAADKLCERLGLRSDPPDLPGIRDHHGWSDSKADKRFVEHADLWWVKGYLSYHDRQKHAMVRHDEMRRAEAERRDGHPCAACYPDDPETQWAQVTQTEGSNGGTLTKIEPKPPAGVDGEEKEEEGPLVSDLPDLDPDPAEYHATAKALFVGYSPGDPEGGTMRSEAALYEYLREQGATIRTDPAGTVHTYPDMPAGVSLTKASFARDFETTLYEQFRFEEPPDPPSERDTGED